MNKKISNIFSKLIFIPFKTAKCISIVFIVLSILLDVFLICLAIKQHDIFTQEELKELATFTLNIVFVIAALGFTIFTLPILSAHSNKDEIILSYIGWICIIASISIFTYIVSYCNFLPPIVFSLYFCIMLFVLCFCMTKLLSTIIAYFDIKY